MKNLIKVLLVLSLIILVIGCGSKETVKEEPVKKEVVEEEVAKPAETETEEAVKEEVEVKTEPEPELPDSVTIMYMIQPNDWLSKIAKKEYGEIMMWRSIWKWNREAIGDNPDLIYPYKELDLQKPREEAEEVSYELVDYTVKQGETLWSIAKSEYGNNLSWIVILRDNYDAIGDNQDAIAPGTILKLRTKLY